MADTAEVTEQVPATEEVVEKKVVDVESDEKSNDVEEVKENGDSAKNGKKKDTEDDEEEEVVPVKNGKEEVNGVSDTAGSKRKSGAGDGAETVDGTPEKKAKVAAVSEESEESNSTNGSAEVAA